MKFPVEEVFLGSMFLLVVISLSNHVMILSSSLILLPFQNYFSKTIILQKYYLQKFYFRLSYHKKEHKNLICKNYPDKYIGYLTFL